MISSMSSLGDIPQILYIDGGQVENLFSMMNQGQISEIVEQTRDLDSSKKGAGIKKILQLQGSTQSESESTQEVVRSLNKTGKFAVIYSLLTDMDSINYLDEDGEAGRDDLDEGDYLEAKGAIKSSPMNDLMDRIDDALPMLEMMKDVGVEEAEEVSEIDLEGASETVGFDFVDKFLNQLSPSDPFYRLDVNGSESELVFNLYPDDFQEEPRDFPGEYTEYRLLSRVEHVYTEAETEYLIDILDIFDDNDREQRTQRKKTMKQMANGASQAVGRDVDESEFKMTYPDIKVRPLALYLF